jgi:NADH:ubiquinone oxidoreductase subunit F (NADH-binding)
MAFDDTRDMVEVTRMAMEFFAEESCGKCFPCRIGTRRLTERLAGQAGPRELDAWIGEVEDLGRTMKEVSACGLGMAAPLLTESLLRYFPDEVARHVQANQGP